MDDNTKLIDVLDGRSVMIRLGFNEGFEEGEVDLFSATNRLSAEESAILIHTSKGLIHLLKTQREVVEKAGDDYDKDLQASESDSNVINLFNVEVEGNA
tara:strand:- start:835 stop:1131 length:297 start_codon:yes stop_codon:yes gene_type:complete